MSFFDVDGSLAFNSSDFTNYAVPFAISGSGTRDLTCNWWGSADGPLNPNSPDPSVYTPWATEPVAGSSVTTCSGGVGVPTTGLTAYWPGDGTTEDVAGGHDGTLIGDATFGSGVVNQAFHIPNTEKSSANNFTGSDWVEIPDNTAWDFGTGDFTIATWVNFSSTFSKLPHQQPLIGHSEGPGNLNKWILWLENGGITFHTNNPATSGHNPLWFALNPDPDVWYHVAVTREGDLWRLYVDGELVQEVHDSTPVPDADTPLTLGKAEDTWLEGFLDEVVIYDRALDNTEVFGVYLAGNL